MTSQTSNLNTTELMTRKLQNKPVTMENCRTYWKKLSQTIQIKNCGKIIKAIAFTLNQTYNHKSIQIINMGH